MLFFRSTQDPRLRESTLIDPRNQPTPLSYSLLFLFSYSYLSIFFPFLLLSFLSYLFPYSYLLLFSLSYPFHITYQKITNYKILDKARQACYSLSRKRLGKKEHSFPYWMDKKTMLCNRTIAPLRYPYCFITSRNSLAGDDYSPYGFHSGRGQDG